MRRGRGAPGDMVQTQRACAEVPRLGGMCPLVELKDVGLAFRVAPDETGEQLRRVVRACRHCSVPFYPQVSGKPAACFL